METNIETFPKQTILEGDNNKNSKSGGGGKSDETKMKDEML